MSSKWESYEMEAFLTISRYSKEAGGRREGRREGVENEVVREPGVRAWWTTIRNLHCVLEGARSQSLVDHDKESALCS